MGKAEATRERILDAALAEFSAHGIAGARVDRIAKSAECNKNLIYVYFENKETLFATVLSKNLTRVYEELAFSAEDVPGYALRVFDFAVANPALMRLMAWSNLEAGAVRPTERDTAHDSKIREIARAQKSDGSASHFDPELILTLVMTLATAWTAANPFAPDLPETAGQKLKKAREGVREVVEYLVAGR